MRAGPLEGRGDPIALLIDFSSLIPRKGRDPEASVEDYRVDSISGQWDYIELVLFGYAAGQVIASCVDCFAVRRRRPWPTSTSG